MADDLLQRGARMLERVRVANLAHAVAYTPGSMPPIEVQATTDSTEAEVVEGDVAGEVVRFRDFLIAAAELTVDDEPYEPVVGDTIAETIDGETIVYVVTPFGSEPHFRYDDVLNKRLRIHTRRRGGA